MQSTKARFEIQKLEDRIAPTLAGLGFEGAVGLGLTAGADINLLNLVHIGLDTGLNAGVGVGTGIGL